MDPYPNPALSALLVNLPLRLQDLRASDPCYSYVSNVLPTNLMGREMEIKGGARSSHKCYVNQGPGFGLIDFGVPDHTVYWFGGHHSWELFSVRSRR